MKLTGFHKTHQSIIVFCLLFFIGLPWSAKAVDIERFDSCVLKIKIINQSAFTIYLDFQEKLDSILKDDQIMYTKNVDSQKSLFLFTVFAKNNSKNDNGNNNQGKIISLICKIPEERTVVITPDLQFLFHSNDVEEKIDSISSLPYPGLGKKDLVDLIQKNLNNDLSSYLIFEKLCNRESDVDSLSVLLDMLGSGVKNSGLGVKISKYIKGRKSFNEGKTLDNFSLPDSSGNIINFYSIKSNYTLIDFWFSRCGPCIESFPELLNLYNKTERSNLEILGISVDPHNLTSLWKSTIKQHNLKWINLLDAEFDIAYYTYSITFYPTTALIDNKTHRIVKINPTSGEIAKIIGLQSY